MLRLFWLAYHFCKSSWINQWHLSDRKSFCSFPANFKRQLIKSLKCRQEQRGLNIWGEEGERGSVGSSLICFLPNSSPFTWPCQLPAWGDLCQSLPNSFEEFLSGSSCGCEATLPPCLSQMCHWTPQMCFQASYLETVPSWRKPYMEETSIHMDIAHDSCTPSGSTATKIIMI